MLLSLLRRYEGWFSFAFVLALIIAGFAGFQTFFGYQPPPTPTPVAVAQANTPTVPATPTATTTTTATPTTTAPPTAPPTATPPPSPTAVPSLLPTDTVAPPPSPTATPLPTDTPLPTATPVPPVNQPPVVQAALVPIDIDDDREAGRFQIQVTATDPENALQGTLIILKLPPSAQERKVKQKEGRKTELQFTNKQLEIKAPDPQAILHQINAYGGIIVQNGEQIDLRFKKKGEGELRLAENGWRLEGRAIELQVIAIDSAGLTSTTQVVGCLQESC